MVKRPALGKILAELTCSFLFVVSGQSVTLIPYAKVPHACVSGGGSYFGPDNYIMVD